jgi:hypothetical protein
MTIPDVIVFEPKVFGDDRGFFESFNKAQFDAAVGRQWRLCRTTSPLGETCLAQPAPPDPAAAGGAGASWAPCLIVAVDIRRSSRQLRSMGRRVVKRREQSNCGCRKALRMGLLCSSEGAGISL